VSFSPAAKGKDGAAPHWYVEEEEEDGAAAAPHWYVEEEEEEEEEEATADGIDGTPLRLNTTTVYA
jgi:hypothetical protein